MQYLLELTTINQKAYKREHDWIYKSYESVAIKPMNKAAKAEAKLAIKADKVNVDGMLLLTVVADRIGN